MNRAGHLCRLVRYRLGLQGISHVEAHDAGDVIVVDSKRVRDVMSFLASDPDAQQTLLVDLFAVDKGVDAVPRFEVHVRTKSPRLGYRAHVVVPLADDPPSFPSLTALFPVADAMEREMFEMLGIWPDDHQHVRPRALFASFAGHPLRKDYRANKEQPLVAMLDDEPPRTVFEEQVAKNVADVDDEGRTLP